MDTKTFFSRLDFDPVEIDNLLDNILLDCPDLILDLLRKTSTRWNKHENNVIQCVASSVEPTCLIWTKDSHQLVNSENADNFNDNNKEPEKITNCENLFHETQTVQCVDRVDTKEEETKREEGETKDIVELSIENNQIVEEDKIELLRIKVDSEVPQVEHFLSKCLDSIESTSDIQLIDVPKITFDDDINLLGYPSKRMSQMEQSNVNKAEINGTSTQSLLQELEDELERLNKVVSGTSLASMDATTEDKIGIFTDTFPSSDHFQPLIGRDEFNKYEFHDKLHVNDYHRYRSKSRERPHSAFEQRYSTGKTSVQNLSKHSGQMNDNNEQELAKCFNLKGTFSLGRNNDKHRKKKQEDIVGGEIQRKSSSNLFKDFQSWQSLQKHPVKSKHKRKFKNTPPYYMRESSIESESYDKTSNRSSVMMEELNAVFDRHLESNSDFNSKIKMMSDAWNSMKTPSWLRLHMSRSEAEVYLKDKPAGSFVIRSSNSFRGAYGLALKVDEVSVDKTTRKSSSIENLVRNYLIESVPGGVRVKGSPNEPIFSDLGSLVREHGRDKFSLPCKLRLPESEMLVESEVEHGDSPLNLSKDNLDSNVGLSIATLNCNVLYLSTQSVESLSESAAVKKAIDIMYNSSHQKSKRTTICQLRAADNGLTLTDTCRSLFFRRYYPTNLLVYAGLNAEEQRWAWMDEATQRTNTSRIFGIVTRKSGNVTTENSCHLFAELDHSADEVVTSVMRLLTK